MKKDLGKWISVLSLGLLLGQWVWAAEPNYCTLAELSKLEIKAPVSGLDKAHIYKIGNVTIAGLAVGSSGVDSVKKLAQYYSSATAQEGYCTWYHNDNSKEAEKAFNWKYVPRPNKVPSQAVKEYMSVLTDEFLKSTPSFLSCFNDRGYVAMGCQGMAHRGPVVFGMILSFSGCSAENTAAIIAKLWGLNGTKPESRLAILQAAHDLGVQHPAESKRLQDLFLGRGQ